MRFVHARHRIRRGSTVIVNAKRMCQLFIMDDQNYNSFQVGKPARCIVQCPTGQKHRVVVPGTNDWNIVLTYTGDIMTLLDYDIGVKDNRLG